MSTRQSKSAYKRSAEVTAVPIRLPIARASRSCFLEATADLAPHYHSSHRLQLTVAAVHHHSRSKSPASLIFVWPAVDLCCYYAFPCSDDGGGVAHWRQRCHCGLLGESNTERRLVVRLAAYGGGIRYNAAFSLRRFLPAKMVYVRAYE